MELIAPGYRSFCWQRRRRLCSTTQHFTSQYRSFRWQGRHRLCSTTQHFTSQYKSYLWLQGRRASARQLNISQVNKDPTVGCRGDVPLLDNSTFHKSIQILPLAGATSPLLDNCKLVNWSLAATDKFQYQQNIKLNLVVL